MNETNTSENPTAETTLGQDLRALLKYWLRGWRGLVIVGLTVAAIGLWLGWSALVAAGIAPLLIGVLPCLAMCALGLCMGRGGNRSCETRSDNATTASETTPASDAKGPTDDA